MPRRNSRNQTLTESSCSYIQLVAQAVFRRLGAKFTGVADVDIIPFT